MRWATAIFAIALSASALAQSPVRDRATAKPPTGRSVIRGRVTAAATGDPLRHAVVRISGASTALAPTLTDEEGRFQFDALPAGAFTIGASKPGFARTSTRVEVAADASSNVGVALPRGGVIAGTMLDEMGEPVIGGGVGGVLAFRLVTKDDGSVQRILFASASTDDQGAFRFGSLPADTYQLASQFLANGVILSAAVGADLSNARVKIPDGPRVVVRSGEEHAGIVIVAPLRDRIPPPPSLSAVGASAVGTASGLVAAAASAIDPRLAVTVRGRVTAGGRPASSAVLQLFPLLPAPPLITQTDENGRYELAQPNGVESDYRVAVRKPGYEFTEYGAQGNRRGTVLHLRPGDTLDDIDIALTPLSTISGRILDDFGDPVEGALVRVGQLRFADGQRKLVDAPSTTSRTDDLGRYRISGIRPGQYALIAAVGQVVVTEAAADFPGYSTTYFPGTTAAAEIQLLSVGAAQSLTDLDFRLVRQKTFKVAGHASDSTGDPVSGGISLAPRRQSGSIAAIQLGAKIDPDGGFEFSNVPAGQYVLQISRGANRTAFSEAEFTYRFIDLVDSDVIDLDLQTGLGSTITGHVTFEGGEPPPLDRIEISAMPADLDRTPGGQMAHARFDESNRFELTRIHGPRRLQAPRLPAGWMLKSVIVNGVDVTDEPLSFGREDQSLEDVEVVLTNQTTRVMGHIAEARDVALSDLAVLAFSSRRDQWYLNTRYIRRTVSSNVGNFTFDGLPPGEYCLVAAYPPDDPGQWRDPDVLEKLALTAARVRLSEGQKVSAELRVR